MHRVAFICIDNSCRSQMAEGWMNHFRQDRIQAYSAGILLKSIHMSTVAIMKEKGIAIDHHTTKSIFTIPLERVTHIITIGNEAREVCPPCLPEKTFIHWDLSGPCEHPGSNEERLHQFRKVRDQLEEFVHSLLTTLG